MRACVSVRAACVRGCVGARVCMRVYSFVWGIWVWHVLRVCVCVCVCRVHVLVRVRVRVRAVMMCICEFHIQHGHAPDMVCVSVYDAYV